MSAALQTSRPVLRPQSPRAELAHVLRRRQGSQRSFGTSLGTRQGLVPADGLVLLARAGGLTDAEIRNLVQSWEGRPWPRR